MFISLPGFKTLAPLAVGQDTFAIYLTFFWICGLIGGVRAATLLGLLRVVTDRAYRPHWLEHHKLEVVWTVIPVSIVLLVAIPTVHALVWGGAATILEPLVTLSVTGHQWYWTYSTSFQGLSSEEALSYTYREEEWLAARAPLKENRFFSVNAHLLWPVGVPVRLIVSGADVIHNFNIPSLMLSVDAVPGRAHRKDMVCPFAGLLHGLCSEVCGPGHYRIACVIEAIPVAHFLAFWGDA